MERYIPLYIAISHYVSTYIYIYMTALGKVELIARSTRLVIYIYIYIYTYICDIYSTIGTYIYIYMTALGKVELIARSTRLVTYIYIYISIPIYTI
jgi:hypothetical protein